MSVFQGREGQCCSGRLEVAVANSDPQTTIRADEFVDQDMEAFVDQALDYLSTDDRRNIYCACFEGGTFCCVDCDLSRRSRTIHNLTRAC
jgi:hypothetical protein